MSALTYRFEFPDGSITTLSPDAVTLEDFPGWTALGFHQCANCPLSADITPRCPMAVAFVPLIEIFGRRISYEPVTARVDSPERTVMKSTTVQSAAGSLMGLLAATSGCPHTDFLAPMAHFHLPFASEEETIYRVASTYLLGQYFAQRNDLQPDWTLQNLKSRYEELQQVNAAMAARLRAVCKSDGTLNALVLLDSLAKVLPYSIDDVLVEVRQVFECAD